MAIWPFGRKGKRPRSQMKASDAADRRLSLEATADESAVSERERERALVARKPSRKRSKRDKHRSAGSLRHPSPPRAAANRAAASMYLDNHASLSSIGQDHFDVLRPPSMLQKRNSTSTKGATLKKRLSKRTAREIQREREIKALSSSPPPHPATTWGYLASDIRRGPSVHSHNRTSNQTLPMDSRSSLSDNSDLYTYKVNALAVLAPRPTIRYENHNRIPPRDANPSSNSMPRDFNLGDEDDWNSHKRVAELADDMDATALRELLERDRRRREKKRLQDQERRQRRLERKLEREQKQEQEQSQPETTKGLGLVNQEATEVSELRGRDTTPSPATSSGQFHPENTSIEQEEQQQQQTEEEEEEAQEDSADQSGSWLREPSKDSQQRENRLSDISAHVIGNIDDRSIRAGKSGLGVNTLLEDDASQIPSPPYLAAANTSSARMSSLAHESISDVSRTGNSEKRLSDTSSKRMAAWISFFRRPSLRKRRSREVEAPPSEFSNTSRDSFMRAQARGASPAHKPAVPIPIPERSFMRTGNVYRSQSKFVEHLGDYPISPTDSRMQSPAPAPLEPVIDMPAVDELEAGPSPRPSFTDGEEYNYGNDDGQSRPMSWDDNSAVLSKSLASIDSEGSWMSGSFLRRISQHNSNNNYTSWRSSTGKNKLIKYDEADENDEEGVASDDYLNELTEESSEEADAAPEVRRASSTAMGMDAGNGNNTETWHVGLERKPTVVRRESGRARATSREVVLGDYSMLDTSSYLEGEENTSSTEPAERTASVDYQ